MRPLILILGLALAATLASCSASPAGRAPTGQAGPTSAAESPVAIATTSILGSVVGGITTCAGASSLALLNVVADVREQVSRLIRPGFVSETPGEWLHHLPRFLKAATMRIERAQDYGLAA